MCRSSVTPSEGRLSLRSAVVERREREIKAIAILDDEGDERLLHGESGRIAVARPDPAIMLEYWDGPEKTAEAFTDERLDAGIADTETKAGPSGLRAVATNSSSPAAIGSPR